MINDLREESNSVFHLRKYKWQSTKYRKGVAFGSGQVCVVWECCFYFTASPPAPLQRRGENLLVKVSLSNLRCKNHWSYNSGRIHEWRSPLLWRGVRGEAVSQRHSTSLWQTCHPAEAAPFVTPIGINGIIYRFFISSSDCTFVSCFYFLFRKK